MRFRLLHKKSPPKLLRRWVLFSLLLLTVAAKSQTVTLTVNSTPIEKVFAEIKKQTGYDFVYASEHIQKAKPVSLSVNSLPLKEVLEKLFKDQPLSYSIEQNYVVVSVKITEQKNMNIEIRGKVVNENGQGIGGVSVKIKNSNEGTATNEDGNFLIRTGKEHPVLFISSVGFESKEIPVSKNEFLNIELTTSVGKLDETIVIAYGNTTQRLSTGSVAKITSEQISSQPVSNPIATMQGRIPGLFITQQNGLPGSNFSVLIRGRNSILSGTDPLYIIDGVPFNPERLSQRDAMNVNNPFNIIDPSSIESITVLKDADATAIYGSRGANGVILITTKNSREKGTHVDFNFYAGWAKVTRTLDYMNTSQYLQMRREAFANDGVVPTVANAPDLLAWDTTRYTDWKKLLISGTARSNHISTRLYGGNENTSFSFNSDYFTTGTVFPGNLSEKRVSLSLSLFHHSRDDKFNYSFSINNSIDQNNLNQNDLTGSINLSPNAPALYDSTGKLNWSEGGGVFANPLAILLREYNSRTEWLKNNLTISYKVLPSLILKVDGGYNAQRLEETSLNPISSQNPSSSPKGSAYFGEGRSYNWIIEPQAEFRRALSKNLSFKALLGSSFQQSKSGLSAIDASGYISDATIRSSTGAANITAAQTGKTYRYEALFGQAHFDWAHSLVLNFTGRRDGSSRFGPDRQFSNFGAVGASWIFSNSKLIKNNFRALSFGKLRASYGITGNDRIDDYKFMDTWTGTIYPYQGTPSIRPTSLFNSDYTWERVKKWDMAIELGLFGDRVLTTVEWFRNRTDNQLISYTLPTQTGFKSILKNFPGVVQNKGWEISLTTENIRHQKFSWTSSFNITIPQNKLVSFPNLASTSYASTYIIGKSLNIIRGYQFLGVDPTTGVYQYLDYNKDGVINTLDYLTLGTKDPKFLGGFENTIRYKAFQLNLLFQFVNQLGQQTIYGSGSFAGTRSNQPVNVLNRWQKPGDAAPYERYAQQGAPLVAAAKLINSDAVLTDASFLRLKNMSLNYGLPSTLAHKAGMQSCKLFIEGQNVLTFTSYKGADPESQNLLQLPPLRQIAAGARITF